MPFNNSLPAYGWLQTSLSVMFVNETSSPVTIRMVKLTNNACSDVTIGVYLDSDGFRTPLIPEHFQLKQGSMAQDDLTLTLRKDDSIEGVCNLEGAAAYVIS